MSEDEPLHTKLFKWLSKQGYPLEMEVAQEFRAGGFGVAQSIYYSDPESGEAREIDVMAMQAKGISDLDVRLTCFVECKVSRDHPWVLFTSDREAVDAQFDYYSQVASELGTQALSRLYRTKYFPPPRALGFRERLGYGVTQGLREKEPKVDVAYQAVMQAAKAAIARAALINSLVETDIVPDPIVELVVPIVVIDGALFEYFLEADLSKTLRTFHWGILSFSNPIAGRGQSTFVHIVTREGLKELVASMNELFKHLYDVSSENIDALQARWTLILRKAGKGPIGT